jgi:hypothetical protein
MSYCAPGREGDLLFPRISWLEAIVKRLQIIGILGLLAFQACSAGDEKPDDEDVVDAGRDVKPTPRADAQGDELDASGGSYADEASVPPEPDAAQPDTISTPGDVIVPPPDVLDVQADIAVPDGSMPPPDAPPPPPVDAPPDQVVATCLVTFTVNGVSWAPPEGGLPDAQVAGRVVRLVGDAVNIGSWAPTAGLLLTETTPGTWSGTTSFRDQQLTEFKFVKLEGATPEWENWLPYDSNRSLRVECEGDAGVLRDAADVTASDATPTDGESDTRGGDATSSDAGGDIPNHDGPSDGGADGAASDATADAGADANDGGTLQDGGAVSDGPVIPVPARGQRYVGTFGVRPADATK